MPGFDRSGPMGAGAMTGGKKGLCNTAEQANAGDSVAGYGLGQGCRRSRFSAGGFGRGYGRGFAAEGRAVSPPMQTATPADGLDNLAREVQNLENSLQMIKKRIEDLQPKSE